MNQDMMLTILLIEDNPGDARLIEELLREGTSSDPSTNQFELIWTEKLSAGLAKLQEINIDVLLLDLTLPDSTGLETFYRAFEQASNIPIIVMSGLRDESVAVQAVREGAQDYLFKGEVNGSLLMRSIRYSIERKQIEDVSQFERDLLHAMMDNIPDTIYFKDKDSRFIRINKAQANILGVNRPEDAVGRSDFDFFPKTQAQKTFEDEQNLMNTNQPLISKVEKIKRADGKIRWVTTTKVPMRNRYNEITGIIGVSRDITEQRMAQEALEKTAKELKETAIKLEKANAEQDQFAYVAFHDLQEPLRMVASYVQLLKKKYGGKLDADADEFIRFAVSGTKRMKRLINDLLIYSRLGGHGEVFETVDCQYVLDIVKGNLQNSILEYNVKISHDPLPKVYGDGQQLMRLFENLIDNAIKFKSQRNPKIDICLKKEKSGWMFSVKDNGMGFDSQYADRIFLIFKRLHSWDEYPGTGIGLAMCKKIVEFHGGRIWAESELGKGTAINFTLPYEAV